MILTGSSFKTLWTSLQRHHYNQLLRSLEVSESQIFKNRSGRRAWTGYWFVLPPNAIFSSGLAFISHHGVTKIDPITHLVADSRNLWIYNVLYANLDFWEVFFVYNYHTMIDSQTLGGKYPA